MDFLRRGALSSTVCYYTDLRASRRCDPESMEEKVPPEFTPSTNGDIAPLGWSLSGSCSFSSDETVCWLQHTTHQEKCSFGKITGIFSSMNGKNILEPVATIVCQVTRTIQCFSCCDAPSPFPFVFCCFDLNDEASELKLSWCFFFNFKTKKLRVCSPRKDTETVWNCSSWMTTSN